MIVSALFGLGIMGLALIGGGCLFYMKEQDFALTPQFWRRGRKKLPCYDYGKTSLNGFSRNDIEILTRRALSKLFANDSFLLSDSGVNERSIFHKFAEYIQDQLSNWDVDFEYRGNQNTLNLPTEHIENDDLDARMICPDISIHQREHPSQNLLIISRDIRKINLYIDKGYRYGLFVRFSAFPNLDKDYILFPKL
jgi:hypothetical protein